MPKGKGTPVAAELLADAAVAKAAVAEALKLGSSKTLLGALFKFRVSKKAQQDRLGMLEKLGKVNGLTGSWKDLELLADLLSQDL